MDVHYACEIDAECTVILSYIYDGKQVLEAHTGFDDAAAGLDVQPRGNERDVREVEDLGSVGKGERPEFWCGPEDVYEALSIARADFGAVRHTNEVRVSIVAELIIELLAWCDDEGLN
ncbi:hypothetical protein A0H81_08687 [Grifola frondosa]|uniref:Uncharacterized protein n=1 Tax=Grifola frondosa TaxID=5627 RepID=A0A1C7M3F4_GRIFR|nr:hypothetical protein A0H81_08687 [Grifola frondosa]